MSMGEGFQKLSDAFVLNFIKEERYLLMLDGLKLTIDVYKRQVHGYADQFCEDVTVRNCEFRFIGGGVWNREQHIRFGNAFEMWEDARDCCFEHNICAVSYTHLRKAGVSNGRM